MHLPIGILTNGAVIVLGGLLGARFGNRLPARVREGLNPLFGLCALGLGVIAVADVKYYAAVALAMVVGVALGEWCCLEKGINHLAGKARVLIDRLFPSVDGLAHEAFLDKYVALVVLFCASGTGIFGAMHEGMTGDASILYIKAILDFFTAGIFAAVLGYAVAAIAVAQLTLQMVLFLLAMLIVPLTTPEMRADFSAAGGLIVIATGLRITGIKSFAVANMLPGLVLVMPVSHLWAGLMA